MALTQNEQNLVSTLKQLVFASEQYYKWTNQLDIRVTDNKFLEAVNKSKLLLEQLNSN